MTSWGRFEREFDAIIEDLTRHGELIDKEANAHHIVQARAAREELQSWRAKSLERLAQEQREQTARQMQGILAWLRFDDSGQIVLFDSLAKVGEKYPGTTDWVLKSPQIASWLRPTADCPFLWLQGGPGTGKSVIAAQLLSFLGASKYSLVIRHFCSYTHDASIQYDQIIKSLLLQCAQGDADLVAHIYEEYVGCGQASLSILEKLLELAVELLQGHTPIHILLDGVDECPPDKQRRLVRLMERLVSASSQCKVLVSSRDSPAIRRRLSRESFLSFAEEKDRLGQAITRYSELRLRAMRGKLLELDISEDAMQRMATDIGERADGNSLHVSCFSRTGLTSRSLAQQACFYGHA